jgi:hypothetical protein
MSENTGTTTSASASASKPFPLKARVILHGLNAAEFNDKIGIVQQSALNSEGRQQVFVEELDKTVALKLANLKYDPRPTASLSNKELKAILRSREAVLKFQGLDKSDLVTKLEELTTDPTQVAEWLAVANAGSGANASAKSETQTQTDAALSASALDQLDNMTPDMLRQQAQAMRSLPPATVRAMNPQLAGMTDAQIQQAAAQMEFMASNPQAVQKMKEQMMNMTPQQKQQYQQMMAQSQPTAAVTTPAPTNPKEVLANMSPEQMRHQAQAIRNMPPDTLRAMNPQFANMTDLQIQQAATQLEMMAENPELMKMAASQMENLSQEQIQEMMRGAAAGGANPFSMNPMAMGGMGNSNSNSNAATPMDPAKMLENMDTAQIKATMNAVNA